MTKIKLGDIFGNLSVIDEHIKEGSREFIRVRCKCGTIKLVRAESLYSGRTKTCGCASGFQKTHGLTDHPHYIIWLGIRQRCLDTTHIDYSHYGLRGITIDPLFDNAEAFISYLEQALGPRPPGTTLGRIDNNGNYAPGNLRWETSTQQNRNRSNTVRYMYEGESLTAAEIAEKAGVDKQKFCNRIKLKRSRGHVIDIPVMIEKLRYFSS